ncbi:acyl-protein thioesterase 1 [Kwoniella dejecticola CBS 10117]|uniref:Acyl-protein thioesterase 1 n=1 Tax=Kwoniella dejecticola CBS 10117 TaxID=1296121 RepID=A0A1A5ZUJ7_9TREE|nr:acyl-protein thioesterase 1 [Kwoniella dejecticola CBS 10117]OBR81476.1 acyl-protein thioesterase 1 [Kwoniella dejecticola CBS 10117]
MTTTLKHLKVSPKEAHTATVIFLHGLGDSGHGWLPVAKLLWSSFPNVKWILPHAPQIPIMLNGGMRMPGWFDLSSLDNLTDSKYDDEAGILESIASVDKLIQAEIDSGIPENKIILGGFSQGGVISILTALTSKRKLGGVVGLSTWVALNHKVDEIKSSHANQIPIFWGHGTADPVVDYSYGQQSIELLTKKLGFPLLPPGTTFQRPGLRFESYRGLPHSSSPQEINDLKDWLTAALK